MNQLYKNFLMDFVASKLLNDQKLISKKNKIISRIYNHQLKAPDFLRFGIKVLAILFYLVTNVRNIIWKIGISNQILQSRNSRIQLLTNMIRFHDSLYEIANVNEKISPVNRKPSYPKKNINYDFLIIGSGPGGAVYASKLQKAGLKICMIESGILDLENNYDSFSYSEMLHKYKYGGINATLGNANIAYVEGQVIGGGSSVNSGLYHRAPTEILNKWETEFGLIDSNSEALNKHLVDIEKELNISYFPKGKIPKDSLKLKEGADNLGWDSQEVPRWIRYDSNNSGSGTRMSMSRTYLKQYLDYGGEIFQPVKAESLTKEKGMWSVKVSSLKGEDKFLSKNVVLAAGTINTPLLLKKTGIMKKAGKKFQMHPTIKVVARFDEKINSSKMGVPVHQVKEFAPKYSFGCSISSKPYLRVAMLDHYDKINLVENYWENMSIYYSMIIPEGMGSINNLPVFRDPLIRYSLTDQDKINLSEGLKNLCKLLFSAGAVELFPSIRGLGSLKNENHIEKIPSYINLKETSLMTVHLFSSCPIGERKDKCIANSYGNVFGQNGLHISDASILPSAPGVNPQGTVMAFAKRNVERIISNL